jgi:hypothetical protein
MTNNNSRNTFNNLLCSAITGQQFKAELAMLIEQDPFYVPAYLEHLWLAERDNDLVIYKQILLESTSVCSTIFAQPSLRDSLNQFWTTFELQMLEELLELQTKHEMSVVRRIKIKSQIASIPKAFDLKTNTTPTDKYLKLVGKIDPEPMKDEVLSAGAQWWNIDTDRAHSIVHHKYTHSIVIRDRVEHTKEYVATEGVHESLPTPLIERFPLVHDTIMNFGETNNLAIGRIAIVRLQPSKKAYRHYDTEEYLEGRNRYHFVLKAGNKNILSSGNETINAGEGEYWLFDNTVMHRAENGSETDRIHVIFDGYPLKK